MTSQRPNKTLVLISGTAANEALVQAIIDDLLQPVRGPKHTGQKEEGNRVLAGHLGSP